MRRNTHVPWAATALFACVLAASGCGGSGGSGHRDDRPHPAVPRSNSPSPPASTAPASTVLPHAADGTDVEACADANCEVLLTHTVTLTMHCGCGLATLTMSVSPGGVDFDGTTTDGIHVAADGQLPGQGGPSTFNQVSVAVVAFNGKAAVIKLSD